MHIVLKNNANVTVRLSFNEEEQRKIIQAKKPVTKAMELVRKPERLGTGHGFYPVVLDVA